MFKAPLAVPYRRPQIQGPQRRSRPLPPSPGQRRPRHPPGLWAAAPRPRPRSPSAPGRGGRPFLESSRPPQTQSPRCRRAGGVAGAPLEAEGGQRAGARLSAREWGGSAPPRLPSPAAALPSLPPAYLSRQRAQRPALPQAGQETAPAPPGGGRSAARPGGGDPRAASPPASPCLVRLRAATLEAAPPGSGRGGGRGALAAGRRRRASGSRARVPPAGRKRVARSGLRQ